MLLTDADLRTLSSAMQRQQKITLTRGMGDVHLTARTIKAPPVWGVDMLVQVRVVASGIMWVQTFSNTGEIREAMG